MWDATAFPMLTGTLITAAGFLPIATAQSSTGEYTRSIFEVVTIALILSWIAAVVFVPYLGYRLLPSAGGGRHAGRDPYQSAFYRRVRSWLASCLHRRNWVIGLTLRAVPLRSAAILSGVRTTGAAGRHATGRGRLAARNRRPGASFRSAARIAGDG
jgi:multidrug efflux pump